MSPEASGWRDWECWRRLEAAASDRMSGSAGVGEAAARALRELVEGVAEVAPHRFAEAVEEALRLLTDQQGSMAPVVNIANAAYLTLPEGPARLAAGLADIVERLAGSARSIGRSGTEVIPDRSTVLTHSYSRSVRAIMLEARRSRRFRVCCTETLPDGEGMAMAADLAATGFQVEVVPDDQVTAALPGMDLVLTGADALGPGFAVNKVGTAALASEAERLGIPFYLAASSEKVLPESLFRAAASAPGRDEFFELIPLERIEGVITEEGVLPAAQAAALAVGRPVAPQLLSRSLGPGQDPPS